MEKKIKKHQVWETDKEWCSALQLTIRSGSLSSPGQKEQGEGRGGDNCVGAAGGLPAFGRGLQPIYGGRPSRKGAQEQTPWSHSSHPLISCQCFTSAKPIRNPGIEGAPCGAQGRMEKIGAWIWRANGNRTANTCGKIIRVKGIISTHLEFWLPSGPGREGKV